MMRLELVKDWMTRDVISIAPDTTLAEADRLLVEHTIRRLPVVENGRLIGIVTYGDIRSAKPSQASSLSVWEMNQFISRLQAAEIMTPQPITVSQESTIGEAAHIMLQNMISGLPVVDANGTLVGIITESDIFRMVVHDWVRVQGKAPEPFAHYGS
ncbi:MAG: CBS domain-containing protein [Anaerolineales bacterium]|nr:CBS domain-containing protein [Anaerolineales bacterium]